LKEPAEGSTYRALEKMLGRGLHWLMQLLRLIGPLSNIDVRLDARCRSVKRVASAVGEGATALQLVHEYLRAV